MGQRNEAEVGGDTGNITLSERRSYANYRIESGSPTVVMIWAIHTTWGVHLAELGPGWVIDDNRPSVGETLIEADEKIAGHRFLAGAQRV